MEAVMKYADFLEDGTTTSYIISEAKGRKTFKLTITGIKVCTLNKELREVMIENTHELKLNKFEDMADRVMKHITDDEELAYTLGTYKTNKLVYLVTWKSFSPLTVSDKSDKIKPSPCSSSMSNDLQFIGNGMYD